MNSGHGLDGQAINPTLIERQRTNSAILESLYIRYLPYWDLPCLHIVRDEFKLIALVFFFFAFAEAGVDTLHCCYAPGIGPVHPISALLRMCKRCEGRNWPCCETAGLDLICLPALLIFSMIDELTARLLNNQAR